MESTVARLLADKGSDIIGVSPDDTVYEALEVMAAHNVGAVIVLDGDALVGILSERDYARKGILLERRSHETRVAEMMTSVVLTVAPDSTVDECMGIMTENRVRHLPVVDDGDLVGVISIGDVVKAVIALQRSLIDQLEQYITR